MASRQICAVGKQLRQMPKGGRTLAIDSGDNRSITSGVLPSCCTLSFYVPFAFLAPKNNYNLIIYFPPSHILRSVFRRQVEISITLLSMPDHGESHAYSVTPDWEVLLVLHHKERPHFSTPPSTVLRPAPGSCLPHTDRLPPDQ